MNDTQLTEASDNQAAQEQEQAAKVEKVYNDKGHLVVELSKRATATLAELTGRESIIADSYVGGSQSQAQTFKTYALMAMRSLTIDGKVSPLSDARQTPGFNARAERLTSSELGALAAAYLSEFILDLPTGEDLKNE